MTPRTVLEWFALLAAAAAGALLLARAGLPAPWLIAPILVAIAAAVAGLVEVRMPRPTFMAAQAAIGMLIGAFAALRVGIPAGALLGPMLLGAALQGAGVVRIALPAAALDAAYLTIGLSIGLLYTQATVRYVLRVLPQLLASTVVLVLLCCASAALLVVTLHVDALSAYLATTPGGLDSVTAIALGSGANVPLVLSIQALRLFVVLVTGPALAKLIVRVA